MILGYRVGYCLGFSGIGFRVWGFLFGMLGLGGIEFRVYCLGFWGVGLCLGFGGYSSGFWGIGV